MLKVQALLYFFYMFLIWLLVLSYPGAPLVLLIIVHAFNSTFLLYEALQCFTNPSYYTADFWNIFDLAGLLAVSLFCFLNELTIEIEGMDILFAVGVAFAVCRGFSYLRAFDSSRFLVGMISAIVKDMGSFFLVLAYALFGLACLSAILGSRGKAITVSDFFANAITHYRVSQGDWDMEQFSEPKNLVLFIIATLLLPLILLNLLIALMGDTFSRV